MITLGGSTALETAVDQAYDLSFAMPYRDNSTLGVVAAKQLVKPDHNARTVEFQFYNDFDDVVDEDLPETTDGDDADLPANDVGTISLHQRGRKTRISYLAKTGTFDDYFVPSVANRFARDAWRANEHLREQAFIAATTNHQFYIDGGVVKRKVATGIGSGTDTGYDLTQTDSKINSQVLRDAVTYLDENNVPRVNGSYLLFATPAVIQAIREDDEFSSASFYTDKESLEKGEIAEWMGVKIVRHNLLSRDTTTISGKTLETAYLTGAEPIIEAVKEKPQVVLDGSITDAFKRFTPIAWKFDLGYAPYRPGNVVAIKTVNR